MSEEEHVPSKTPFEDELEAIEKTTDKREKAQLTALLLHDIYAKGDPTVFDSGEKVYYGELDRQGGTVYLQPGVPLMDTDMSTVREVDDRLSIYATTTETFIRVPQTKIVRVPKQKKPSFYAQIDKCSVIVGYGDHDVWFAHVGLSEKGAYQKILQFMQEQGIENQSLFAVSNDADIVQGTTKGVIDTTKGRTQDLVNIGIPEDNIISFIPSSTRDKLDMRGVVVTNDFVASYPYEIRRNNITSKFSDVQSADIDAIELVDRSK